MVGMGSMNRAVSVVVFIAALGVALAMGFYRDPQSSASSQDLLKKLRETPGVIVTEYSVTGQAPDEIMREISQRGPKDFYGAQVDAYTAWRISWVWPEKDGAFDFKETKIEYAIEVTVPRWEGSPIASRQLQSAWERYLVATLSHERNHVEFVLKNYPRVAEKVRESAMANPNLTTKEAHLAASSVLAEIRALDRSYDESTQHGRTEGAVLKG